LGRVSQNRRKISPETKGKEKLREDKHWAHEHMNRIIEQRRPAMLEQ
jgi:hypothetical protein